jgi:hypothetical protein
MPGWQAAIAWKATGTSGTCDLPKYDQTFTELAVVEFKAFFASLPN